MPELPEVETIKIGLSKILPGQIILRVNSDWPKSFPNTKNDVSNFLIGATVTSIRRRAKVLIIELSSKYSLIVHLKMTGQLVYHSNDDKLHFGAGHPSDSLIVQLPEKSTRVILELDKGTLYFNDQRKFGWMRLLPTVELPNINFFKKAGPEPLESGLTKREFIKRIERRKNTAIKAVLLDQTVIAGIGNIYADEALWGAKIHPATLVKNLSKYKLGKLLNSIRYVLKFSIEKGGSSDRNYVDINGNKGAYLNFASVFRKQGQPCPRCGTIIIKTRVAGRGTHICPKCQRLINR